MVENSNLTKLKVIDHYQEKGNSNKRIQKLIKKYQKI